MKRDYIEIAKDIYSKEQIDTGIETIDEWQDMEQNKSLAFSQGFAVNEAVRQFKIPKVSHVAQYGMICGHGLIGIRAHYKNGMAQIYLADNGTACIPVAVDFQAA